MGLRVGRRQPSACPGRRQPGGFPGAAVGVGRSSASHPAAPPRKMGVLGDRFREGLGAKRCGEEKVARKNAFFGWKPGRNSFDSFCIFLFF